MNRCTKSCFRVLFTALLLLGAECRVVAGEIYNLPDTISPASVCVSILVASPVEDEVYTVYGHAGLRIADSSNLSGLDITFNWGIFQFTDGFLVNFIRGKKDYAMEPWPTSYYVGDYLERGSTVTELKIDLTDVEKQKLWKLLQQNLLPENRIYRYNFFYDNCSTRPVAMLLRATGGQLLLPGEDTRPVTFREMINRAEAAKPWLLLGTDLAVGAPADRPISRFEELFLPGRLVDLLPQSQLRFPDGSRRQLVRLVEVMPAVAGLQKSSSVSFFASPLFAVFCWIVLVSAAIAFDCRRRGCRPVISAAVGGLSLTISGLVGCLLFFLVFFSEDPCMSPNYNLLVFHPLHLFLGLPVGFIRSVRRAGYPVLMFIFAELSAFVLFGWCLPEHFNVAVYGAAIVLMIIYGHRLWLSAKYDRERK